MYIKIYVCNVYGVVLVSYLHVKENKERNEIIIILLSC